MDPFIYPVPPAPRTAVLVPWFRNIFGDGFRDAVTSAFPDAASSKWGATLFAAQPIRVFREGWGIAAAEYAPAAIAGTCEQLRELTPWRIPSLTHAVIVLARPDGKRLSDLDRDRLWRAFQVPVFEQIVALSGELLAFECEAHDGLHVESPDLPLDGETLFVEPCPCGRKTPRIGVVEGLESERRAAAFAR